MNAKDSNEKLGVVKTLSEEQRDQCEGIILFECRFSTLGESIIFVNSELSQEVIQPQWKRVRCT